VRPISIAQVATVTAGEIHPGGEPTGVQVTGVAVDSRRVRSGDLFIALSGERTDGHKYLAQARAAGASAAVVRRDKLSESLQQASDDESGLVFVAVDDPGSALVRLAAWNRCRFQPRVVAVTGSVGKTTCKDMTAAVVGTTYFALKTPGNYNTEIGTPLTLMELDERHEACVLELAARQPGDLSLLADLARPEIGVLTNIRESHLELFSTVDNVARAKGELFQALPSEGWAILNADDPRVGMIAGMTRARLAYYTTEAEGPEGGVTAAWAGDIELDELGRPRFSLCRPDGRCRVALSMPGRHHVHNALAAAAAAYVLGIDLPSTAEGLESTELTAMRTELQEVGPFLLINDAYNSSPTSCRAALDTLTALRVREGSRRVAVLGDMLELGRLSERAHAEIGRYVSRLPCDLLITVGDLARLIAEGGLAGGMAPERVFHYDSNRQLVDDLPSLLEPGDVILIKASRGCRLEEVARAVERLCSREEDR